MRYVLRLIVVLVGVLALVACSGPDEVEEPDAGADAVAEEEQEEDIIEEEEEEDIVEEEEEEEEEEEVCEPVMECAVDECGSQDDGCGGTIECGACDCIDGVAQIDGCGVCDLGVVVCGEAQTGPSTCEEREIPGVSECNELVFVDQVEGSDLGAGTKEDPIATLADGFGVAQSSGALAVLVAGDESVTYSGPILLEERISLMGGYDSDWVYQEEHLPLIESDAGVDGMVDGDLVGISVKGVNEEVIIANFEVYTGDVTAAGGSNYGVHVMDSPGLELKNMEVHVGRGGDGENGEVGDGGAGGASGGSATNPTVFWISTFPGEGGVNEECSDANGGDGGKGGLHGNIAAEDGADAEGGAQGGESGTNAYIHFSELASFPINETEGEDGENGPIGSAGQDGIGGSSNGNIAGGFWSPTGDGVVGEDGLHGSGGGGGGGAGGGEEENAGSNNIGSSGGGGASGGCGGSGGTGGSGGGGSFGLFVVSGDFVVDSSRFFADVGGAGGDGGDGGSGGSAGLISGFWSSQFDSGIYYEATGGKGGRGGDGGDGGAGGGGAGGVSYGAYCSDAAITTVGTVRFVGYEGATGGGGAGNTGDDGEFGDSFGCD